MDLTVAIISYNTKDLLEKCLKSVNEAKSSVSLEIVVVDNNSADGSVGMVREKYPEAKIFENQDNLGFAKGCNQAIKKAAGNYVLLLNSDTEIVEGCFDVLHDFMNSHENAGAVGPKILNFDGSVQYSCRDFPSFADATVHAFLGAFFPSNPFSKRYKRVERNHESDQEVDWISGAALCLRKEAVESIGCFDEHYYMYVEDMDLCYRLRQKDWGIYYNPKAKVYHHIGQSSKQMSSKMMIEHQKSIYRFYSKLYKDKPWRHLKFLIGIGLFFRGLLLIFASLVKRSRNDERRTPNVERKKSGNA